MPGRLYREGGKADGKENTEFHSYWAWNNYFSGVVVCRSDWNRVSWFWLQANHRDCHRGNNRNHRFRPLSKMGQDGRSETIGMDENCSGPVSSLYHENQAEWF